MAVDQKSEYIFSWLKGVLDHMHPRDATGMETVGPGTTYPQLRGTHSFEPRARRRRKSRLRAPSR